MTDVSDEAWCVLEPLAQGAVQSASRKYYRYTEREDIYQELLCWAIAHPKTVNAWVAEDDMRSLERALNNEAHRYGQKEKAARSGYAPEDVYFWQRNAIEDLLPALWDVDEWLNPTHAEGTGHQTRKDPAEGGNWQATLADLSRAFSSLSARQQWFLEAYYRDKRTQGDIAEEAFIAQPTVSEHISRAIKKMHQILGGSKPRGHWGDCECTGSRHVMTNAAANAKTEGAYEA